MEIKLENREKIISLLKEGICPICGKKGFKNPLGHISQKHKFSARKLKDTLLIGHNNGFNSPELTEQQRQNAISRGNKDLHLLRKIFKKSKKAIEKNTFLTKRAFVNNPEQLKKFLEGQKKSYMKASELATAKTKKAVVRISNNDEKKIYNSLTEAAKDNGVTVGAINKCLRGKNHTAAGFKWEYKN